MSFSPLVARTVFALLVVVGSAVACERVTDSGVQTTDALTITVDSAARYQTMHGWEATAQMGQDLPGFSSWAVTDLINATDSLGLNRLRLELRAGVENPVDWYVAVNGQDNSIWRQRRYETINDNADPFTANPAGFQFSQIDKIVDLLVTPLRARLAARGEALYVNLNVVAFVGLNPVNYVHQDPEEFAELILETFKHFQQRLGWVPDGVELVLEPDNNTPWTGQRLGAALVATARRLRAAGYTPEFIGPSTLNMRKAGEWHDAMLTVPGAAGLLSEFGYHRYAGVSAENLRAIADRGQRYQIRTGMLEHIGADVNELYDDITLGNASTWQQFTLAYNEADNGGKYFQWTDGRAVIGARTRYLRQYFQYVRRGAIRVGATVVADTSGLFAGSSDAKAVAFVHPTRGFVVVVHTDDSGSVAVRGLRPGRYGVTVTTAASVQTLPEVVADAKGVARVTLPASAVATFFAK